jgi:Flp pilus assembly pilin Flp
MQSPGVQPWSVHPSGADPSTAGAPARPSPIDERSGPPAPHTGRCRSESGQSTVEYALILLGAAAVALVVVAWVTRTDLIGRLFDTVVGSILRQVT